MEDNALDSGYIFYGFYKLTHSINLLLEQLFQKFYPFIVQGAVDLTGLPFPSLYYLQSYQFLKNPEGRTHRHGALLGNLL